MTTFITNNDYLIDLLTLQQDGRQAISAPANWLSQTPLLEVSTKIDEVVKDISNKILLNNNVNSTARWHFFIGSPGNGKSAAIGGMCRYLYFEHECSIVDEDGVNIEDLDSNEVPYALYVYEKNKKYASVMIIQDASVVRNPFSSDVDPALDLIKTLQSAWSDGVSLIVCTNRGVIEKAYRDTSNDIKYNKTPWFKILRAVAESDLQINNDLIRDMRFDNTKTVFDKVHITCSHLDNMSLLIGSNVFKSIIRKAIEPERWEYCDECSVSRLCPYKTNQEWLLDETRINNFLRILERAEVYSGQIIVFREALAIISLILAGCPKDYVDFPPCEWVKKCVEKEEYFRLASRRIYMTLFSSYAPYGLEQVRLLQEKQVEALTWLYNVMPDSKASVKNSLKFIEEKTPLSTDVGVTRLLGEKGIMAQLDPVRSSLPSEFYNIWDAEFSYVIEKTKSELTDIEIKCIALWESLEQGMEYYSEYKISAAHWALKRWSSNFLLHFGAVIQGLTAWSVELDQYKELLEIIVKPQDQRRFEEKKLIRDLNNKLVILFNTDNNDEDVLSLQLTETAYLTGRWAKENIKPMIISDKQAESLTLLISFKGTEAASLSALMFIWLNQRAQNNLNYQCFPPELLSGVNDARVRAAAKSNYAFVNDDVEIKIIADKGERFTMLRIDGEVEVQYD